MKKMNLLWLRNHGSLNWMKIMPELQDSCCEKKTKDLTKRITYVVWSQSDSNKRRSLYYISMKYTNSIGTRYMFREVFKSRNFWMQWKLPGIVYKGTAIHAMCIRNASSVLHVHMLLNRQGVAATVVSTIARSGKHNFIWKTKYRSVISVAQSFGCVVSFTGVNERDYSIISYALDVTAKHSKFYNHMLPSRTVYDAHVTDTLGIKTADCHVSQICYVQCPVCLRSKPVVDRSETIDQIS